MFVFPPINGGLHCGHTMLTEQGLAVKVFPPINGGLHCGQFAGATVVGELEVFPPINGGLHCGDCTYLLIVPAAVRVPAYQRRAPLRRRRTRRLPPLWRSSVFPPINGGLHCGGT